MNILHITPHLGGGVGSVVLNWMMKDKNPTKHTIISLDKNNNKDWIAVNENYENVSIIDGAWFLPEFKDLLCEYVKANDIVVMHWWNHPLLYDVMINYQLPKCRLVMWNHVSGLFPPYVITKNDIDFCDRFVFTSPVSYETKEVKRLSEEDRKKLDVNWSTIGVESFKNLTRTKNKEFTVGFTGTVDFGKLNPAFIELCKNVNVPNVKFVVCSGDSQQHLIDEAKEKGVYERFSFEGRVPSIVPYVAMFDVYGYPLQPQHFATCEQAIGEAMMAGAVPVVLNNPTERFIVKHMETGIVANSFDEYSKGIEYLYNNPEELKRMQSNAMKFASEMYDINKTIKHWYEIFDEEMKLPKQDRMWLKNKDKVIPPEELYAYSHDEHGKPFWNFLNAVTEEDKAKARTSLTEQFATNSMYKSKGKGSVFQYLQFWPNNETLIEWSKLINKKSTRSMSVNTKPLITIAIPTYNRCELLKKTLESIQNQTYSNLEIIVSDNHSDDLTEKFMSECAKKDPRIKYYRREKNFGTYGQVNFLIEKATGDFYIVVCDDDWIDKDFVERCYTELKNDSSVIMCRGSVKLYNTDYNIINVLGAPKGLASDDVFSRIECYIREGISNLIDGTWLMYTEIVRNVVYGTAFFEDQIAVLKYILQGKGIVLQDCYYNKLHNGCTKDFETLKNTFGLPESVSEENYDAFLASAYIDRLNSDEYFTKRISQKDLKKLKTIILESFFEKKSPKITFKDFCHNFFRLSFYKNIVKKFQYKKAFSNSVKIFSNK